MLLQTDLLWNSQVGLKQEGRAEGRAEESYLADIFFFCFSQLLLFSVEFSFSLAAVPGRWPPSEQRDAEP